MGAVKVCKDCSETKSVDDFYRSGAYWGSYCKPCTVIRSKVRYEANRAVLSRASGHKSRYGLSPAMFEQMLDEQNGVCFICKEPETRMTKGTLWNLSVDHDHLTGDVRSLLCNRCNVMLGWAKESGPLLLALADYLLDFSTDTSMVLADSSARTL